ncbi:MAG: hypothetical protein E5X98_06590, partial [Mesorhizobium sp.]
MARNPCGCCQAISCPTPGLFRSAGTVHGFEKTPNRSSFLFLTQFRAENRPTLLLELLLKKATP